MDATNSLSTRSVAAGSPVTSSDERSNATTVIGIHTHIHASSIHNGEHPHDNLPRMQSSISRTLVHFLSLPLRFASGNLSNRSAHTQETAGFPLDVMAGMLDRYIRSVIAKTPGRSLPSRTLRWGNEGNLVVQAWATTRCSAFKGSIKQFLQMRHRNPNDDYRFETDMKSRLTELGMKKHYKALIEYVAPIVAYHANTSAASRGKVHLKEWPPLKLPSRDLVLQISDYLSGKDLLKIQLVCRELCEISKDIILYVKNDGAQEVRKWSRDFVKDGIRRLFSEGLPPEDFKKNLEQLIARHYFICVDLPCIGSRSAEYFDILLGVLAAPKKQTHFRSLEFKEKGILSEEQVNDIVSTLATVSGKCRLTEFCVDITSNMTQAQVQSLIGMQALTSVSLGYCSENGYRTLAALLAKPSIVYIHGFSIGNVSEGPAEWALVKKELADNKTIRKLCIASAADAALAAIVPALAKNKSLETLKLRDCKLNLHSLMALAEALEHNTGLTSLYMGFTDIDDAGVAAFAPVLEKNKTLRHLALNCNKFGPEGAQALARSLKNNTTLTEIDLSLNSIDLAGVEALAAAVPHMKNLKKLNLEHVGSAARSALEALRTSNPSLQLESLQF